MSSSYPVRNQLQCCIYWIKENWDEYLQKRLGKVTSVPPSLVVIKEIIESLADPESLDS